MRLTPVAVAYTLLCIAASTASAGDRLNAEKAPWQWTTEERLAVRFDAASMRARIDEALAQQYQFSPPPNDPAAKRALRADELKEVILGDRNPELYLPWELFETLLHTAYGPQAEGVAGHRMEYGVVVKRLHLPADFWAQLGDTAKGYLDTWAAIDDLTGEWEAAAPRQRARIERKIEELNRSLCRERAAALARARTHFGAESFDRFLYEAVPPGFRTWSSAPMSADDHRKIEGGCK